MSDQNNIVRNQAAISFIGTLLDTGISFAGIIIFATILGADGLGVFYLMLALVEVATIPVKGIGQAVIKRGSEIGSDRGTQIGTGLALAISYVCVLSMVIWGVVTVMGPIRFTLPVIVGGVAVLFTRGVYFPINDGFRSTGQTGPATLVDNVLGIVETILQIGVIMLGYGVPGLLAATAVTTIIVGLAETRITAIEIDWPSKEAVRSLLLYAKWMVGSYGLGTIYSRLPLLVIGAVVGNSGAGVFSAVNRLLILGSYVGGSIAPALFVQSSEKESNTRHEELLGDVQVAFGYAGILGLPLLAGGSVIAEPLVSIVFRPAFAVDNIPLIVGGLGLYHLINAYDTVLYAFINGSDHPEFGTGAITVATFIMVGFLAIPILNSAPIADLLWVIGVKAVAHIFHLILGAGFVYYEYSGWVFSTKTFTQVVSAAVMCGIVIYLTSVISITGWVSLLATLFVGGIVYGAGVLIGDSYLRSAISSLITDASNRLALYYR